MKIVAKYPLKANGKVFIPGKVEEVEDSLAKQLLNGMLAVKQADYEKAVAKIKEDQAVKAEQIHQLAVDAINKEAAEAGQKVNKKKAAAAEKEDLENLKKEKKDRKDKAAQKKADDKKAAAAAAKKAKEGKIR